MHAEASLAMEHDMRSTPHARMQQKRRYSSREHHYITPSEGRLFVVLVARPGLEVLV